ncbi:DUF4595 domain-containing protein [Niabella sp.]|uniref:DUF4595 domain-containing protein n=1 Tax=Niabella sp. TaxID=1962976 RepID=UPI002610BDE0|nr:DUF4595 domain-containing protein [Niabella sp.]
MNQPFILFFFLLTMALTGCSKDKRAEQKPACRITSMTSPDESYTFTYNAEGKLTATKSSGTMVTNFTYSGNTVTALTISGSYYNKTTYTINSTGQVTRARMEYNTAGTLWTEKTFEYNGALMAKETHTTKDGFTSVRSYQWSNGNLQRISFSNSDNSWQKIEYEYYPDQPYQDGDMHIWDKMSAGVEIYRSKNLVKKYTSTFADAGSTDPATEITNYSYAFDSDGKIRSMTASSGSYTQVYQYQHQCDTY